jgi:magnesium transporter
MTVTIYTRGLRGLETTDTLDSLPRLLAEKTPFWLDIDEDSPELREALTTALGLHHLAVEDIFQERLNPKVEDYGDYLYIVLHGIALEHDVPDDLRTVEIDLVLSSHWVISHHPHGLAAIGEVIDECQRNLRLFDKGPGFIAHAIMDHAVDCYFPVIEAFDHEIDQIESAVVDNPQNELLQRIFKLKRSLQRLRRVAMHQREVLLRVSRGEFELIPEKSLPFFRDIHDHFVRVSDLAEGYREGLTGVLDAYLSVVSNRMNEVMKALTLVATIMLPLTFIAGVYGMNFEFMPELHWRHGYAFALALMLLVAVAMIGWFRSKRWL